MEERKEYCNLDVAKFLCALLIIVIHTRPLLDVSPVANFYTADVLARTAVPLFFAMSGFLFFRKLQWQDGKICPCGENRKRLGQYLKRVAHIYLCWSLIYTIAKLPQWYATGWWGMQLVRDVLVSWIVRGSHYHLWYLLASLYAMPILYVLLRYIPVRKILYPAGLLLLCECLVYSYSWLGTEEISVVSLVLQKAPILFHTVFRAVPLLAIGALCTAVRPGQGRKKFFLPVLACFLLCVAEASVLYFASPNEEKYSYLLVTPFFVFFTMEWLLHGKQLSLSQQKSKMLRDASLTMYCMHPLVIIAFDLLQVNSSLLIWGVTTVSVTIFSLVWKRYRDDPSGRKVNQ